MNLNLLELEASRKQLTFNVWMLECFYNGPSSKVNPRNASADPSTSVSHSRHSQFSNERTDSKPERRHGGQSAADRGEERDGERAHGAEQSHGQPQPDAGSHPRI